MRFFSIMQNKIDKGSGLFLNHLFSARNNIFNVSQCASCLMCSSVSNIRTNSLCFGVRSFVYHVMVLGNIRDRNKHCSL